jgi:TPR repeat protein
LARCYATGQGDVTPNINLAFSLYKSAAEQDDVFALFQVGTYYSDGRAGEKNAAMAYKYFKRAAELGDLDGIGRVSQALLDGEGVDKSVTEAIACLQKAVDRNYPPACYNMAEIYARGLAGKEKIQERIPLLCKAAIGGLEAAQTLLAEILFMKLDTPTNLKLVFDYFYKLAIMPDSIEARFHVGRGYINGSGVQMNTNKGIKWLKKAILKKHLEAYNFMIELSESPILSPQEKNTIASFLRQVAPSFMNINLSSPTAPVPGARRSDTFSTDAMRTALGLHSPS